MKIRHDVCIELAKVFLETVGNIQGLSVSEVLVALAVAEKLMRKGTADLYHSEPAVSEDEIEVTSETIYEALILSGRRPQN